MNVLWKEIYYTIVLYILKYLFSATFLLLPLCEWEWQAGGRWQRWRQQPLYSQKAYENKRKSEAWRCIKAVTFTNGGEYPLLNIFCCISMKNLLFQSRQLHPSAMLFPHWAVSENKWFLSWYFFLTCFFFCYLSISHRRSWQTTDEEVCRSSWHQRHTAMHWTGRWEIGVENWKIDLEIESDNNQIHQWTSIRAESKGKLSIKPLF